MHSIGSMAPSRSRNRPNRRRSGQTSFFSVLYRRPMSTRRIALSLYACLGLALGVGCSSTADHGILGKEHGNARVAREAAIDFGLLADPELDLYMNEIGQRLVFSLPRPSFAYSFRVVNEAQPKAWVRPGGFGYLSRGLLSLANNEDEVACVLGHEIIHAEQRHVAPRQASNEDANPLLRSWHRAARRGPTLERWSEWPTRADNTCVRQRATTRSPWRRYSPACAEPNEVASAFRYNPVSWRSTPASRSE